MVVTSRACSGLPIGVPFGLFRIAAVCFLTAGRRSVVFVFEVFEAKKFLMFRSQPLELRLLISG